MKSNKNTNLIYYICPFASNDVWKENLNILKKYLIKFTGVKIITISTGGDDLISPTVIKNYIDDDSIIYLECENNRKLGEVLPFIKMLTLLRDIDPIGITFYAHAKGVSPKYNNNIKISRNIKIWRNILYYFNLGDFNMVKEKLTTYTSFGCMKRFKKAWYYAGTFFWFDNEKIFTHPRWNVLSNHRSGVEFYLSRFEWDDGYCYFGDNNMRRDRYKYWDAVWNGYLKPYNLSVSDFDL
jgi:hypothetical protein